MIDAAKLANSEGAPINRLLTVRTAHMRRSGRGGILTKHDSAATCVSDFLNRHARWCRYRCIPVVNIWVREYCPHYREHFHLGYHMLPKHDADYARQISSWLCEDFEPGNEGSATIASSELGSWQIDRCIKGGTSGHHIAAYLGKSEPNTYLTGWGKERRNTLKKRPGQTGGEGPIEGTTKHHYRWGTSLTVGRTQRDRNGL